MARGEGIKPLGSLFEKYRLQLKAPQGSVKKAFCEVVHDLFGFAVKDSDIEYSTHNKIITLKVRGPMKSEILMRKDEILAHLKGRLGEKSAPTSII